MDGFVHHGTVAVRGIFCIHRSHRTVYLGKPSVVESIFGDVCDVVGIFADRHHRVLADRISFGVLYVKDLAPFEKRAGGSDDVAHVDQLVDPYLFLDGVVG